MRVIFHGVSHDISHLVVASVVNLLHGMQDSALHRLQTIVDLRHGAVEDDIRGVVQEPVLEHALQRHHTVAVARLHKHSRLFFRRRIEAIEHLRDIVANLSYLFKFLIINIFVVKICHLSQYSMLTYKNTKFSISRTAKPKFLSIMRITP